MRDSMRDPLIEKDSPSARLQARHVSHQRPVIFRATSIFRILRIWGCVWQQEIQQTIPGALSLQPGNDPSPDLAHVGGDVVFCDSIETTCIDVFVSHAWADSRMVKALAMLYHTNIAFATIVAFAAWLGAGAWSVYAHGIAGNGGDPYMMLGLCYIPVVAFFTCLFFGHFLRCGLRDLYWLDRLCIHQTNGELKLLGVSALPEFVANSNHMLVLWSEAYFERLWCVSEIGIFMIIKGGAQNIHLQPLWLQPWLIACIVADCIGVYIVQRFLVWVPQCGRFLAQLFAAQSLLAHFLAQTASVGLLMGVSYIPSSIMIYLSFSKKITLHKTMTAQIAKFSVSQAKCTLESDRAIIEKHLIGLMEEDRFLGFNVEQPDALPLERFDSYVRIQLLKNLEARVGDIKRMPYRFAQLLCMPLTFASLGSILGCDGAKCQVTALDEGFSSDTQFIITDAVTWFVFVVLIMPAMYAFVLQGVFWLDTVIPSRCCRCCVGSVMVVCAYAGAGLTAGCVAGLTENALTTTCNMSVVLLVAFLTCLVYVDVKLFIMTRRER